MKKNDLLECIDFFNLLSVSEEDVTTDEERALSQKTVIVTYRYDQYTYKTKTLYYKSVREIDGVKNKELLRDYFGYYPFWLDINIHGWPQGSGESDLENIVIAEIANENETSFVAFLKKLANNNQTGYIQRITEDGRSGQYYHNLENNNHWHDIIKLIKAVIGSRGQEVDKNLFSPLVFKWDGDKNSIRERSTLTNKAYTSSRYLIDCLYTNIQSVQQELSKSTMINLLKQKKQIILQGPPGTGKTKLAKEIAEQLTKVTSQLDKSFFLQKIQELIQLKRKIEATTIIKINGETVECIRDKAHGSFSFSIDDLYKCYNTSDYLQSDYVDYPIYAQRIIIRAILSNHKAPKSSGEIEFIQFHPSYTYEDFVRGVVATPNEDGDGILYKAENKLLGDFAEKALNNFLSNKGETQSHSIFQNKLYGLLDNIREKIDAGLDYQFGDTSTGKIIAIKEDGLLYNFPSRENIKYNVLFTDLEKVFNSKNRLEKPTDLRDQERSIGLEMKGKFPYYYMLLKQLEAIQISGEPEKKQELKNYVLIIDEINRANLSSVLGELIYGLEYRGDKVDSIYKVNGSNKLILPPNLYIIGTMNTADRSVGHIDYAIRRRFAFVDVLPTPEPIRETGLEGFKRVASLFIRNFDEINDWSNPKLERSEHLTIDFRPEDVMLGHSYFITKEKDENELSEAEQWRIKARYEIVPILKEYVKDGVLHESEEVKSTIQYLLNV